MMKNRWKRNSETKLLNKKREGEADAEQHGIMKGGRGWRGQQSGVKH